MLNVDSLVFSTKEGREKEEGENKEVEEEEKEAGAGPLFQERQPYPQFWGFPSPPGCVPGKEAGTMQIVGQWQGEPHHTHPPTTSGLDESQGVLGDQQSLLLHTTWMPSSTRKVIFFFFSGLWFNFWHWRQRTDWGWTFNPISSLHENLCLERIISSFLQLSCIFSAVINTDDSSWRKCGPWEQAWLLLFHAILMTAKFSELPKICLELEYSSEVKMEWCYTCPSRTSLAHPDPD